MKKARGNRGWSAAFPVSHNSLFVPSDSQILSSDKPRKVRERWVYEQKLKLWEYRGALKSLGLDKQRQKQMKVRILVYTDYGY